MAGATEGHGVSWAPSSASLLYEGVTAAWWANKREQRIFYCVPMIKLINATKGLESLN